MFRTAASHPSNRFARLARSAAAVAGAFFLGASPAWAFQVGGASGVPAAPSPATVPAAPAGDAESLKVVVAEVVGKVAVSTDDAKTWKPATVGLEVGQGAQFRTGLKSSVTCVIPPDQTFKLESLSTIRVSEAVPPRDQGEHRIDHEVRGRQLRHREGGHRTRQHDPNAQQHAGRPRDGGAGGGPSPVRPDGRELHRAGGLPHRPPRDAARR